LGFACARIGVLQATYVIAKMVMLKQYSPSMAWRPAAVVVTHLALAYTAFHAAALSAARQQEAVGLRFRHGVHLRRDPWAAIPLFEALGWSIGNASTRITRGSTR